jgi:hypothetical protein
MTNNPWIIHVKSFAAKNKISYRDAISKARASYKKKGTQTVKDKKDESKGMKGQVKGTKSKSKKNFENKENKKGNKKETVELDGKKVTFNKGGLHKSLKVEPDYTFKRGELNRANKVSVGDNFKFKGSDIKMTGKIKKQLTLGLNLMKK